MNFPERPFSLRAGLVGLFVWSTFGLVLETLHAFKVGFLLDVDSETRRLLFRLAHAHGALLGLLNICHAIVARTFPALEDRPAERMLVASLVLMPTGFLLGGCFAHGADPGASVGLAAAGGLVLSLALGRLAWRALRR